MLTGDGFVVSGHSPINQKRCEEQKKVVNKTKQNKMKHNIKNKKILNVQNKLSFQSKSIETKQEQNFFIYSKQTKTIKLLRK